MLLDQTTFGGVEARILLSSSLRQVFEEPTYFRIPIGAVLWRRRGERREREAYSRGGEANRVIWQGCLLHRGRGIINFNYTTRREAAWRKGSRNKLTATASVPNLPPHQLHQPTTPHRTQQSGLSTSINTVFPTLLHRHHPSAAALRGYWLNATHPTPLRTRLETWEKGGRGGCFWHRSWPTINIIYRRLNRPAASNRRL